MSNFDIAIHKFAQEDVKNLARSGLKKQCDTALTMFAQMVSSRDPYRDTCVVPLDRHAPGWFRFHQGTMRVIFRFVQGQPIVVQIVEVGQRRDDTYTGELQRRYSKLEKAAVR